MEIDHSLSQEDIDALFRSQAGMHTNPKPVQAFAYDFRRTDRIPKEQIRALRSVHETFARSLASSLSAYLRTYVTVNVISVEQLSFREFVACLPSPTCMTNVRFTPFDAVGVLEMNPQLAFPLIEFLLGGGKVAPIVAARQITTIEEKILNGILMLILQNLAFAWQTADNLAFSIEGHESEPALMQVLPPNEAVVVIASEVQIGDASGMMNIAFPSSIVKLLRQKVNEQWSMRKSAEDDESERILALLMPAEVELDARMRGATIAVEHLAQVQVGDVLEFDFGRKQPVDVLVNGIPKYRGEIVSVGNRRGVAVRAPIEAGE